MPLRDVIYLIVKPFLGQKKGATKAEILSRAVEHGELKSEAAELTRVADEALQPLIGKIGLGTYAWFVIFASG
jgi:hypothetical protein